MVMLYEADDIEDFNKQYEVHDAKEAGKTMADDMFGIFQSLDLDLKTPRIRNGGVGSALAEVWGLRGKSLSSLDTDEIRERVVDWKAEILLADSLYDVDATPSRGLKSTHNNATVAAMLLSFRRYGDDVAPFWSDVSRSIPEEDTYPSTKNAVSRVFFGGFKG